MNRKKTGEKEKTGETVYKKQRKRNIKNKV